MARSHSTLIPPAGVTAPSPRGNSPQLLFPRAVTLTRILKSSLPRPLTSRSSGFQAPQIRPLATVFMACWTRPPRRGREKSDAGVSVALGTAAMAPVSPFAWPEGGSDLSPACPETPILALVTPGETMPQRLENNQGKSQDRFSKENQPKAPPNLHSFFLVYVSFRLPFLKK